MENSKLGKKDFDAYLGQNGPHEFLSLGFYDPLETLINTAWERGTQNNNMMLKDLTKYLKIVTDPEILRQVNTSGLETNEIKVIDKKVKMDEIGFQKMDKYVLRGTNFLGIESEADHLLIVPI